MELRIPKTGNSFPGNRSLRSRPATYVVKSGDTIYTIACYYGDVDPNSILLANPGISPNKLTPGQTLNIP
jgi:LysM repeat protein